MTTQPRPLIAALLLGALPALTQANCNLPRSTPSADFERSPSGWAIHRPSALMWTRCPLGSSYDAAGNQCSALQPRNWETALLDVQALNAGAGHLGFNDWRLPTLKELISLHDLCGPMQPALNREVFPMPSGLIESWFWSSTPALPAATQAAQAWAVNFIGDGEVLLRAVNQAGYVRLVRDASSSP